MQAELLTLGGILLAAAVAMAVGRATRAPPVAAFILAGFLLRALLPEGVDDFLAEVLFVSLAFLLFDAGARVNPGRFTRTRLLSGVQVGLGGGLLLGLAGGAAALAAGWSPKAAIYAAAAIGPSSTLLVLDALALRGEIAFPHGRLLVQSLLLQDIAMIALFALLPNLPGAPGAAAMTLLATIGLAILAMGVARATRGKTLWRAAPDADVRTLLAFGILFAFILLATSLGIPSPAGAFLAGLAIAAYPANVHFRPAVRAARDFFSPLFFVSLGALLPLPPPSALPLAAGFLALYLLAKPLVLALIARANGMTPIASGEVGTIAAQGSEFALVLATAGVATGHLTLDMFGTLGIPIALSMLLTSPTPRIAARALERLVPAGPPPPPVPGAGHIVVLGTGVTGRHLVNLLHEQGEPVVAVDVDPAALAEAPAGVPTVSGDAADPEALEAARIRDAKAIVCLLKTDRTTIRIVDRVLETTGPSGPVVIARVRATGPGRNLAERGVVTVQREALVADALARLLAERRLLEPPENSGPV